MSTALAQVDRTDLAVSGSIGGEVPNAERAIQTLAAISKFVQGELLLNTDYGEIPGTNSKQCLWLPGAQKIAMLFNTCPIYDVVSTELGNGHVEFTVKTTLVSRSNGLTLGAGVGSCSTMESKYRYRQGERMCPKCKKAAIIKGKEQYGGGWLCFRKKDGCGAKYADGDRSIEGQTVGRVENPDIYDMRNTVLKMAKKRSLVDASMGLGCVSDLFTQDLEEGQDHDDSPARADDKPTADRMADRRAKDDRQRKAKTTVNQEFKTAERPPKPWTREEYESWRDEKVTWANAWWLNIQEQRAEAGTPMNLPEKFKQPFNRFLIQGHLCKYLASVAEAYEGLVRQPQEDQIGALSFQMAAREPEFSAEIERYVRKDCPHKFKAEIDAAKTTPAPAESPAPADAAPPEPTSTDDDGDVWAEGRE